MKWDLGSLADSNYIRPRDKKNSVSCLPSSFLKLPLGSAQFSPLPSPTTDA